MWTYVIVDGSTEQAPGLFGSSTHKDYICYVSYSSVQDNITLIKDYFRYYCSFDYDKLELRERPPIDDYNCILAILTYYYRDQSLRFEYDTHRFSRPDEFPQRNPEKETDQYKVWVDTVEAKEITTVKSAAWMLYEIVGYGRISVEQAQSLVREKFPEHIHAWDQIMNEFRRYGGAHTKKHLRRL